MRLLLDTHALLWWFTNDDRLSKAARRAIADARHEIYVSAASAWEISAKHRLGKLAGLAQAAARYAELVAADGFIHLDVNHVHSLRAGAYDAPHRDPFDRMLAAQSEVESLRLVTCDAAFEAFRTRTLW